MQKYIRQNMQFKDSNTIIVNRHKLFLGSSYHTNITDTFKSKQNKYNLNLNSDMFLLYGFLSYTFYNLDLQYINIVRLFQQQTQSCKKKHFSFTFRDENLFVPETRFLKMCFH